MTTVDQDDETPDDSYDPFEAFNRSAGIGVVENPYPMFALARSQAAIKREDFGATMIAEGAGLELMSLDLDESIAVFSTFSFDAAQQVLKDGETFSSARYADVMGQVFAHSILEMDDPEHHTYRGLVQH